MGELSTPLARFEDLETIENVDVSVIIPTLNESATIGNCIERILQVFSDTGIKGEIIVVDNSTDKTPQIAKELGAKVITSGERGYGSAYLQGFKHINGDYIVIGDGDNTYDFGEIPKLLEPLSNNEADLVMGSRFKGNILPGAMPWLHRYVGNPLLTWMLNLFFKAGVSDAHCGLRAFTREALESMNLRSTGMELASEMVILAARLNFRISEVPISYYPRVGESKLHSFQDGWRHLKFMLFYAPTYLYFMPGVLLSSIGLLLIISVLLGLDIGFLPGLHSMIAGNFMLIIGYQTIVLSIIAHVFGKQAGFVVHEKGIYKMINSLNIKKGLTISLLFIMVGMFQMFILLNNWINSNFTMLPLKGIDILSFTFIFIGFQTFFNSFLISMITNR